MKRLYGYEGINVSNQYVKKQTAKNTFTQPYIPQQTYQRNLDFSFFSWPCYVLAPSRVFLLLTQEGSLQDEFPVGR